jgi:hypothetical protein
MKKKVIKIEVVEFTAERGERKGQKGEYIKLSLQNRGNNWIAGINKNEENLFITRPQNIVDVWKDFAKQMADQKKTIEEIVPDEFRLIDNVFKVNVPLDDKYVRVYRQDDIDPQTRRVLHHKGDIVMLEDGKTPAVYDALNVLAVKYEDDDTGEMMWLQEPSDIVRQLINRGYYRRLNPISTDEIANGEEPAGEAGEAERPTDEPEETVEELERKLAAMKGQA